MKARALVIPLAVALLALSGCSVTPEPTTSPTETSVATPTIDPSLIPTAEPTSLVPVDPAMFLTESGDYLFKAGNGPTWCTIVPDFEEVVCEMNEADAQYKPIPTPETCDYSYGYQVQLVSSVEPGSEYASFLCAGGYYSDPADANVLNTGEVISAADFNCFVQDVTARCENAMKKFIVLGPKAWALGN